LIVPPQRTISRAARASCRCPRRTYSMPTARRFSMTTRVAWAREQTVRFRRRKAGRIVTLASVSALMGNRGQTNYSAAKAGVIAATKSLAIELAKRDITVNCVAPGLIDTEMVSEEVLEHALAMIPMRRMGTVEEVAGVVAFLLGPEASYITRQVISVNGGMVG